MKRLLFPYLLFPLWLVTICPTPADTPPLPGHYIALGENQHADSGDVQSAAECIPLPAATPLCSATEEESPWIFRRSYYSHDPRTGNRVAQYQPIPDVYRPEDPTYMISGFRHHQMILRGADGSADRLHVVETWGRGEYIRPYGEWEYPYRAGATPYGPWGNPQGPWTLPFDSWINPYGLGQLPNPPWGPYYYRPYNSPYPHSSPAPYSGGQNGGSMPYQSGPHSGMMPSPTPPPAPTTED